MFFLQFSTLCLEKIDLFKNCFLELSRNTKIKDKR